MAWVIGSKGGGGSGGGGAPSGPAGGDLSGTYPNPDIATATLTELGLVDGWVAAGETWTRTAATTFTVPGDLTVKYSKGTRIKLTQTTAKYFVVVGSSHAAGTTTVTVTAGSDFTLAAAAITSPSYSYLANPQGYPSTFAFDAAATGFNGAVTGYSRFSVVGRVCTINIRVSGTSNATTAAFTAPVASANAFVACMGKCSNNGADTADACLFWFNAATAAVDVYRDSAFATWTAANGKSFTGVMVYEI